MAELRDWTNRTVLHVDFDKGLSSSNGEVKIVFQQNIFIDNSVGWRDEINAEFRFFKFIFEPSAIKEFVTDAKKWLALPLNLLGVTFFEGIWDFGAKGTHCLSLNFSPYYSTPSKTDWFTVSVTINANGVTWEHNLQVDHSCLAQFVEALAAEC